MSEYFPKPKSFGGRVKVDLDLYNYATEADFKNATGIDTSATGLNSLKSKVDELDVDKLVPVLVDSSKLSYEVKNDVKKKSEYYAIIKDIEDKIPDITNVAPITTLDKIKGVKGEISIIHNLATNSALNAKINEILLLT